MIASGFAARDGFFATIAFQPEYDRRGSTGAGCVLVTQLTMKVRQRYTVGSHPWS